MDTRTDNEMNRGAQRGRIRSRHNGLGFPLLLILIGIAFLLFNTGVIPAVYRPLIFSWQTLLIVIGLCMIAKRSYFSAFVLILIGGFFLLPRLGMVFPELFGEHNFSVYWPLLLIILGIAGIVVWLRKPCYGQRCRTDYHAETNGRNDHRPNYDRARYRGRNRNEYGGDVINKNVAFSGSEQIVLSQNFRGGEINAMFGECVIDLRKARLATGNVFLGLNSMFGSITIFIPEDMNVVVEAQSMFGGVDDKRPLPKEPECESSLSTLNITAKAMFGSVELRN